MIARAAHGNKLQVTDAAPQHEKILTLVAERLPAEFCRVASPSLTFVEHVGHATFATLSRVRGLLSFVGEALVNLGAIVKSPRKFRIKEFTSQLETVCIDAIPVCALVTGLIGVVVAYLFASQMERYGASIFIVEAVGIAMVRELSPIIVAIIVAGRSGSAFTAQIGTMKLNEEVDAMRTLGLHPMHVLVFPRVMALVLAMPLLTFVGDVTGIVGGLLIANGYLGITPATFMDRLQDMLAVRHVYVGLVKAPVFAVVIALIGCRMGLTVEDNARSVGLHTTSTVVQSIVAVILLNAAFAIALVELDI